MELYALVLIVVAALVLLALLIKLRRQTAASIIDVVPFTKQERFFYGMLCQAVSGRAIVLGKLRIKDVERANKPVLKSCKRAYKKIAGRYFDFMIFDPVTAKIIAVISLETIGNQSEKSIREQRDLAELCQSAGVKLLSFQLAKTYDVHHIFSSIYPAQKNNRLVALVQSGS